MTYCNVGPQRTSIRSTIRNKYKTNFARPPTPQKSQWKWRQLPFVTRNTLYDKAAFCWFTSQYCSLDYFYLRFGFGILSLAQIQASDISPEQAPQTDFPMKKCKFRRIQALLTCNDGWNKSRRLIKKVIVLRDWGNLQMKSLDRANRFLCYTS